MGDRPGSNKNKGSTENSDYLAFLILACIAHLKIVNLMMPKSYLKEKKHRVDDFFPKNPDDMLKIRICCLNNFFKRLRWLGKQMNKLDAVKKYKWDEMLIFLEKWSWKWENKCGGVESRVGWEGSSLRWLKNRKLTY